MIYFTIRCIHVALIGKELQILAQYLFPFLLHPRSCKLAKFSEIEVIRS